MKITPTEMEQLKEAINEANRLSTQPGCSELWNEVSLGDLTFLILKAKELIEKYDIKKHDWD